MSKQGKVLILALLAFLIFFVSFKIYHSKDVQASTIKLVNKSNETYAYSGSKKLTGLQKINGNNYYFDSTTGDEDRFDDFGWWNGLFQSTNGKNGLWITKN